MKMQQSQPKLSRQILDEASAWFVDFRVGDVDQQARERFDHWLRRSPEHIRAYMEIARTYVELPAINPNRKIDVQELIAYARSEGNSAGNVVPIDLTRPSQPLSQAAEPTRPVFARSRRGAIAASIAIVGVAASLLTWFVVQGRATYATEIGERRSITLSDGSTIDLNARSKIRVNFSQAERAVELVDGQALFEVTKDKTRPFVVHSGATLVRAVGTQFDVYRKRSGTTVTVIEGRVAVLGPEIPPPQAKGSAHSVDTQVFLSAGEQVTVTGQAMATPKHTDVAAATAWMHHSLVFDGSRLSDVVEDFNRYNTRQLVIDDRKLDDFRLSGVYSSTDPASLIRFLQVQPGIQVIETDEGVRITRK